MPELTAIHLGLLLLMIVVGIVVGWMIRADRCAKEKIAVSARWQDQLESQQSEHNRLAEQNKSLMEQINQYQASQKDYSNRAKELSDSLKEAFARRDELQRQIKDVRGNLEVAIAQRNRLQGKLESQNVSGQAAVLKEKDDKIFRLSRELTSWQSRVPPLVERYRERDKQAATLEETLEKVQTRLHAMEEMVKSDHTRIEPVDADSLPDGGDASNEPIAMTSVQEASYIQDQIDDDRSDADDYAGTQSEIVSVTDFDNPTALTEDQVDGSVNDLAIDQFGEVFVGAENEVSEEDIFEDTASGSNFPDDDSTADPDQVLIEQTDQGIDTSVSTEPVVKADTDDLKEIKGIGPAIEKTLNDLGIFRFHQIAEMSEYEIDQVAQQLKGFRSRIYREDWIGQARDLHYEKSNHRS